MFRLKTRGVLRLLFIAIGAVTALISFALGQSVNFGVFSRAANALLHAGSLYPGVEPYFKYGPPFALAFIPFALVPAWLGAAAWGALNFGVAFEGLAQALDDDARLVPAAGLALVGVLLTTDGDQSNLLVTGLVLLAVAGYRRGTAFVGPGMLLAFAVYVKIFPILFAVFALHAKRPRVRAT